MDGLEEVLFPEGLEELEPPLPLDGFVTVCVSPFGFVVVWVVEPSLFVVTSVTVPSFVVVISFVVPSFWRVTSLTEPSFAVVTSFTVPSAYCSTTVVVPSSFWTVCVDSGISMEETESVSLTGSVPEDDTTSSPPPAFRATNVTVPAIKRTAAPAVDPMATAFFLFSRIHIFNCSIKCFIRIPLSGLVWNLIHRIPYLEKLSTISSVSATPVPAGEGDMVLVLLVNKKRVQLAHAFSLLNYLDFCSYDVNNLY